MPSGSLTHEAARSLIVRALQAEKQSEAELLINAAYRIDSELNAEAIKNIWLEQWLETNKDRNGEPSHESDKSPFCVVVW